MVGSEELEPGDGWNYSDWLGKLTAHPEMNARDLGSELVRSYGDAYGGRDESVTLSAIDLTRINDLAQKIDVFSDAMSNLDQTGLAAVKQARKGCEAYAPGYGLHGIDLSYFAERVGQIIGAASVKTAASSVVQAVTSTVIANYAGSDRKGNFGSKGLSIYFPEKRSLFQADPDNEGYMKTNAHYPVEFVQTHKWADFLLNRYLPTT
jgi:hypothetical protein